MKRNRFRPRPGRITVGDVAAVFAVAIMMLVASGLWWHTVDWYAAQEQSPYIVRDFSP